MRRPVLLLVFLTAAAAIAAPPTTPLPGESLLADPLFGAAPGFRSTPAVAASANRLLTVWIDRRGGEAAIFGSLLDRTATFASERSFRIGGAAIASTTVAAASDGRDFLVAWGRSDGFHAFPVRFARVDELGNVTPLPGIVSGSGNLQLVWTGLRYVLLSGTPSPVMAVLTRDGVVERSGIAVTLDPLVDVSDSRIATDGRSGIVVTWVHRDDRRVHAATVATEQLIDGTFVPFTTGASPERGSVTEHAVAWNGSEYLIAWVDFPSAAVPERVLRIRRVARTGEPLSPTITLLTAPVLHRPHVAWSGANWVITGMPTQRQAIRVSAAGTLIGDPISLTDVQNVSPPPAVAADGGVFVAWADASGASALVPRAAQIRVDLVLPAGTTRHTMTKGALVSRGDAQQDSAAIAPCGTSFAVAWVETNDRPRVRLGGSGNTSPQNVPASELPQIAPAVACGNATTLVVWTEPVENRTAVLYGSIRTAGGMSPAFTIGTTTYDSRPAAVWNGSGYTVAWKSAQTQQLILSVLDVAGRELEPAMAVQDVLSQVLETGDRNAAIVWTGTDYFLAWQRTLMQQQVLVLPPFILYDDLQTLRLSPGRTRLGAVRDVVAGNPARLGPSAGPPALAASPNGYLLSWFETAPSGQNGTLKYLRFDRDGNPLDGPNGVALASVRDSSRVSAAWNGTAYEVAFDDTIFTVFPDGRSTARRAVNGGDAEALAYLGDRPLLVFTRRDPNEGTLRLWTSDLTAAPAKTRRRPSG